MLPGMRHDVRDQFRDMSIGKFVMDVFSATFAGDQVFRPQDTEALRDRGERFAFRRGQFGHARRSARQQHHQPEPFHVADGPEHARRVFEGVLVKGRSGRVVFFGFAVTGHEPRLTTLAQLCK